MHDYSYNHAFDLLGGRTEVLFRFLTFVQLFGLRPLPLLRPAASCFVKSVKYVSGMDHGPLGGGRGKKTGKDSVFRSWPFRGHSLQSRPRRLVVASCDSALRPTLPKGRVRRKDADSLRILSPSKIFLRRYLFC